MLLLHSLHLSMDNQIGVQIAACNEYGRMYHLLNEEWLQLFLLFVVKNIKLEFDIEFHCHRHAHR